MSEASVFERHAQTLVGVVASALMLWTGNTLLDVRDRLARIEVHQLNDANHGIAMRKELGELRQRTETLEAVIRARTIR